MVLEHTNGSKARLVTKAASKMDLDMEKGNGHQGKQNIQEPMSKV